MKTVIIATLLAGCVTQPLESTTEQQSLSPAQAEARARIEVTNYYTCQQYGVCGQDAIESEPPADEFISIDCYIGTGGVACCVGGYCCSVYWSAGWTCYGG